MALRKALLQNGVPALGDSEGHDVLQVSPAPATEPHPFQRLSVKIAETSEQVDALKAARDNDKACLALLNSCASLHPGMAKSWTEPPASSSDLAIRVDKAMEELSRLEARHQELEEVSRTKPRRSGDDGRLTPLVSLEVPTPPKVHRVPRLETKWQRLQSELLDPQPILREYLDKACRPERAGPRVFQKPATPVQLSRDPSSTYALSLGSFESIGRDPLKDEIFRLCQPW
mmetsp:Transcript_852/g.2482  ORF Transcript_852/g.2482 Transcript_852/m.2482 type:complete len:230 (-) Transcript_852:70-759(-)